MPTCCPPGVGYFLVNSGLRRERAPGLCLRDEFTFSIRALVCSLAPARLVFSLASGKTRI